MMSMQNEHYIAKKLEVMGMVQGVGIRQIENRLDKRNLLCGHVCHTAKGVNKNK